MILVKHSTKYCINFSYPNFTTTGIGNHTLNMMGAFLSSHTQMSVVNCVHSSYVEVISGVQMGSVLGLMLF